MVNRDNKRRIDREWAMRNKAKMVINRRKLRHYEAITKQFRMLIDLFDY